MEKFKAAIRAIEVYFIIAIGEQKKPGVSSLTGSETREQLLNRLHTLTHILGNIPPSVTSQLFLENYNTTQFAIDLQQVCLLRMRAAVKGLYVV